MINKVHIFSNGSVIVMDDTERRIEKYCTRSIGCTVNERLEVLKDAPPTATFFDVDRVIDRTKARELLLRDMPTSPEGTLIESPGLDKLEGSETEVDEEE